MFRKQQSSWLLVRSLLLVCLFAVSKVSSFTISSGSGQHVAANSLQALSASSSSSSDDETPVWNGRRSIIASSLASLLAAVSTSSAAMAWAADTGGAQVRGIEVTPFNSLIFQYRGSEYGGLKASEVADEKSVTYKEFIDRMKAGEVEFVEFIAPDGDAAYVTFKTNKAGGGDSNNKAIRIGEGYPTEQHDGWSSPAFAVRAVQNAGVPYKFSVPALQAYNK